MRNLILYGALSIAGMGLWAQSPGTGAIAGRITDGTGAALAQAMLVATESSTRVSRSVTSSAAGEFRIALLSPGTWSLSAAAPGFETALVRSVSVVAGETTTIELKLNVGKANESIEVSDTADVAQTETSTLGRAIDEQAIESLPLANRNYTQLIALSPGVVVELPNAAALGRNNQNVSANGGKTTANNFQFNGIDANNLSQNSASGYQSEVGTAVPSPDSIQEFKVQTGNYDAGYGRGAGANVDLISRSGHKSFHGSAWEYLRNDALNANDFFAKRNGQPRPVLKQHQFGVSVGGPLTKGNTFFFVGYQGTRQKNGDSSLSLVTAILPQLGNDRSPAALGAQFCPDNQGNNPGYLAAFGGVKVACDGSNINPSAAALLNFKFPNGQFAIPSPQTNLANQPGQIAIGESTYSIPADYREDQFTANVDRELSNANELSGRFFYSRAPTIEPFSPFGANVPGWGTTELDQNHMFVLSDTHTFNPNVVNVARFGFMRFDGDAVIAQPINAADVGMATPAGLPQTPGLVVNGLFTIGTAGQPFYWQNTNSYVWQDTISLTRGLHSLRFGAEAKRHQVDVNVPYVNDGFLFLLSFPDFLLGESGGNNPGQNGTSVSNIFLSIGSSGIFRKDERYADFAGFVQDDVLLRPWFTLNAGLRYEIFGPPSDIHGRLPTFDPSIATPDAPASGTLSGFVLPGNYRGPLPPDVVRSPHDGMWATQFKDVSPRIGFSARLPGRTTRVVRGGYGIYYDRMSADLAEQTVGQPPFSFKQSLQGAQNGGATLQQPYNPSLPPTSAFPVFLERVPGGGLSLAAISPRLNDPYIQQYDLNVQTELTRNLLLEIGYVGAKSTHVPGCVEFNQALLASETNPVNGETTNTIENLVQRLPYTGIAPGSYTCVSSFDSRYNALETSLTQRLSHGLEFLASYTWSKNLDTLSGSGGLSNFELGFLTNDQTNQKQARGPNDFDRTHRAVLSLVYSIPAYNGGPALLKAAISNWRLSTVAVAQSGTPLTVTDSSAGSVYGNLTGFMRAECTGANPASSGSLFHRINGYFNPDAFAAPPAIGDGTGFGNCGVGILRGPNQKNIDVAVERRFSVWESGSLHLRGEFFNAANRPEFGNPVLDHNAGPAFGLITSTVANPRLIQLALRYQF
jgi:hypothetical protein